MQLKKSERLGDLLIDGLKIIQNKDLYCFTSDAVILSKFASFRKGEKVADFCAGSGIVGLHYYALHRDLKSVDGFEIQTCLADMFSRTIEYNGLEEKFKCHNIPVQDIPNDFNGKFSLILCNPPYKKVNSGEKNPDDHIAVCRHEVKITLEEIIAVASKKLKHGGRLAMCQRTERLSDMICLMRENGLEPFRLQFVTAGKDDKPYLVLIEAAKGVKPQLKVLPNYRN